jgi:hypothetical protein
MVDIVLPEVSCSTAKEFLQVLSPVGDYFYSGDLNAPWLFRGQGKDYPLIPSLFRKNSNIKNLTQRNLENYTELLSAERDLLVDFFRIADKRGLVLPDDSQELRRSLEEISNDENLKNGRRGVKITDNALSLMALAQHYGIPTRLLDWTLSSYIAAFFAAEDANKKLENSDPLEKLVVWAFYFPNFGKQTLYGSDTYLMRGITAPSASNPNLKAQQGVFTLIHSGSTEEMMGNYRYKPFDEILTYYASSTSPEKWLLSYKLQKFTLPISESPYLLFLLAKLDIAPSSVYPGYHSILNDLKNRNTGYQLFSKE